MTREDLAGRLESLPEAIYAAELAVLAAAEGVHRAKEALGLPWALVTDRSSFAHFWRTDEDIICT